MSHALDVAAVVPAYHPTRDLLVNVRVLRRQVPRVIVVDDGTGTAADEIFTEITDHDVDVVRLPENQGIAAALNVGVTHALKDSNTRLVLTLDQDSTLSEGFVENAVRTYDRLANQSVGIVVPAEVGGQEIPTRDTLATGEALPLEPIQSGMLIARRTFDTIGMFRAELIIDCVDSEFFLRARRAGILTVVDPDCSIEHQLGEFRKSLPGRQGFSYHSPLRRFYITRNRLTILREFRRSDPHWFRHVVREEVIGFAVTLVFGSQRPQQLVAAWHGLRAFRRGIYGPIPSDVLRRIESKNE